MANLLIEIGNTAVKASWSDEMTLGKTFRYQGEKAINFILSLVEKEKPEVMVVASVYEISQKDLVRLQSGCNHVLILDNAHTQTLEDHNLPSFLTYDRAASLIAAKYLFTGSPCCVLDLGTTLTIDFIDNKGNYSGGNISLGCRTRFKALNRYSKALALVDTPESPALIGHSVISSIESGVISGIMFEIEGYISLHPENIVVFTGGDAIYFAKKMKTPIFVVCNLVLMGLALIADNYVQKNLR